MSDAPPKDDELESPPDSPRGNRRYPNTPMPSHFEDDIDDQTETSSYYSRSMLTLFVAIAIAHLWTVWTLRADMNIVMQFLQEITQQNKHITDLLHNQHQVKWQIVPTQL